MVVWRNDIPDGVSECVLVPEDVVSSRADHIVTENVVSLAPEGVTSNSRVDYIVPENVASGSALGTIPDNVASYPILDMESSVSDGVLGEDKP